MIPHGMNNHILISGMYSWCGYQDEYENWELYQEIIIFGVGTKTGKKSKLAVHVTHAIINAQKYPYYILERWMGLL